MRILIIDDEAPARELLSDLLSRHPHVEVAGEASDIEEALELCSKTQPDVLFLDIEMGAGNGFQILDELAYPQPAVVFVTAHEQFALSAFEVSAVDYLLKPVHEKRLIACLDKLQHHLASSSRERKIYLTLDTGMTAISPQSITHIQADENYTSVFLKDGKTFHVRKSLQSWESLLPAREFTRIHRSLLVNLSAVENINLESRDTGHVLLNGHHQPLRLARRALQRLRQLLSGKA